MNTNENIEAKALIVLSALKFYGPLLESEIPERLRLLDIEIQGADVHEALKLLEAKHDVVKLFNKYQAAVKS